MEPRKDSLDNQVRTIEKQVKAIKGLTASKHNPIIQNFLDEIKAVAPSAAPTVEERILTNTGIHAMITTFMGNIVAHSPETEAHIRGVTRLTAMCAESMITKGKLTTAEGADLCVAAMMHDDDKQNISQSILHNPGKLEFEDNERMQNHPKWSEAKADQVLGMNTGNIVRIIGNHHENLLGTGYPRRLKGNQLTVADQVMAIADKFEAMTAWRSYKMPFTTNEAMQKLRGMGKLGELDPALVETLAPTLTKFGNAREEARTHATRLLNHTFFKPNTAMGGTLPMRGYQKVARVNLVPGTIADLILSGKEAKGTGLIIGPGQGH